MKLEVRSNAYQILVGKLFAGDVWVDLYADIKGNI
jgi:hypothetical protein